MNTPAKYAREIPQRYRLEAAKCQKCGKIFFPPRLICDRCQSRSFETVRMTGEGKLLTYTIIHVPPSQFVDEAPYAVGIVELNEGVRITAQVVDCEFDRLKIGMDLKIEFRKIQQEGEAGILCYGYKCVPA